MLLKILILAVIAWFILRAARNLLLAVVHDQMSGRRNTSRQTRARQSTSESNPHGRSANGGRPSGKPTVIHRRRGAEEDRRDVEEQDIEDARFRDL